MNTASDRRTPQPRALPALQIPSIDISGRGGLGMADLADPKKLVPMFAIKAVSTCPGDYVELFWNRRVIQNFVLTDDQQATINFTVQPLDIPDIPDVAETFYRITTPLGGNPDDSPLRQVRVKRSVPGAPDPVNSTPTVNENLLPPHGVPPAIDEPRELTLMIDPWPEMHEGDVLSLYWGLSQHAIHNPPLTREQLGKAQAVVVSAALQLAGGASERLMVNYDIRDLVDNWSLYSLPTFSNVDIDPTAPSAPAVMEADPLTGELDLAMLGDEHVHVQIPTYTGIAIGDRIILHWLGRNGADLIEPDLPPKVVDDPEFAPQFVIDNAVVTAIADGFAVLYFDVQPLSGAVRKSRSTTVLVKGYPLLLPPPRVEEGNQYHLDPLKALEGATVHAMYNHMNAGQQITLIWDDRQDIAQPAEQPGSTAGTVSFNIPPAAIAAAMGKPIGVFYSVTRQHQTQSSDGLVLGVLGFPDHDTALLQGPKIVQAPDNHNLDLSQLNDDADLMAGPWPFIATGQKLWLHFEGIQTDGTPYQWPHPQWQGHPVTALGEQHTRVALEQLRLLKDGTELNLLLEVSFDGGATKIALPVRTLKIWTVRPVNGHASWESAAIGPLPLEQPIEFANRLTITISEGAASIIDTATDAPAFGSRTLHSADSGRIRFDFGGMIRSLLLTHRGALRSRSKLHFYDAQNQEIQTLNLVSNNAIVLEQIDLSRPCTHCEVVLTNNTGGLYLDNLLWTTPADSSGLELDEPVQAVIWRIFDDRNDFLPDGSLTESTALVLEGSGEACSVVRLLDHDQLIMAASVTQARTWSIELTDVSAGQHAYRIQAPDNALSPPWLISVAQILTIDDSPLLIIGLNIQAPHDWLRTTNEIPGNTATRTASGGTAPYTYSSGNSAIASVDSDGKVTAQANGTTTITARDSRNRAVSYPVEVKNAWKLVINEGPLNFQDAMTWIRESQGRMIDRDEFTHLLLRYRKPWPTHQHYWLCSQVMGKYYFYNHSTQTLGTSSRDNSSIKAAWCLLPN